ncbi:MAG TPA: ABC transporter permease [Candidatus Dormibacteraeota bacterium]|nr:ABC transporter permease [Candidatus Dormibacteraeota bacterium]
MGVVMPRRLTGYAAAVRLGWAVSSNWTRPILFITYSVLRPISVALILAVMYAVITHNAAAARPYLAFLIIGTAFWSFIQEGVSEFATGILEDRGRFHILKYSYMAPLGFPIFLFGRATSKLASAAASVVIVLVVGTVGLQLPINALRIDYPLLIAACLLAFISVVAFAITLSMVLLAGRDTHGYGEIMAQFLYLFSGAIFPIGVLPGPIAWLAALSPLPYWLELCRRAILHGSVYKMFPSLSDGDVLLRLLIATAGTVVLGYFLYRWTDRRARGLGYIDMEANW